MPAGFPDTELREDMRNGLPVVRVTGPTGKSVHALPISTAWQHLENGAEDSPTSTITVIIAHVSRPGLNAAAGRGR